MHVSISAQDNITEKFEINDSSGFYFFVSLTFIQNFTLELLIFCQKKFSVNEVFSRGNENYIDTGDRNMLSFHNTSICSNT